MTPERWREIEALYHAVRARPPAERAAFLAAATSDDALRREVEQLIGQSATDEGFLAGGALAMAPSLSSRPAMMTGRALGDYRVDRLIGVGGMGEVYRARDAKLGRDVAIKVLPHAFTSHPVRFARFEREARTLAALNHTNICAIYGFEHADGVRFLVLELVDGETLAERIARSQEGGLGQREALSIARQIARALDFAHERGIVHRDLKPANIKISSDGTIKILDFGLAKAAAGDAAGADLATIPAAVDGTMEGMILGTPAYMSPEQARGKPVDKRTDIWAFGCTLFEMLTGRATFHGETPADTIAQIIEREPDWSALPPATPEPIRNLLFGCLAKEPKERLRDIGDVRITIDGILSGSSGGQLRVPAATSERRRPAFLPWTLVAVLVLAIAAIGIWSSRRELSAPAPLYTVVELAGQLDRGGGAHVMTLSHDGTKLAYVVSRGPMYIRELNSKESKPVPGTEIYGGIREPYFSPDDSEIVAYTTSDHSLTVIPLDGGKPQPLGRIQTPTGIDWWKGGILYGQGKDGIWRISPNGGEPTQVATVEPGEEAHGPHVLPDDDHFIFTVARGRSRDRWDDARIVVASLTKPNDRKVLDLTGSDARYIRNGYLVYAISGVLRAVAFDLHRRDVVGKNFAVEEGVSRAGGSRTGAANFSVSDQGTFVFVPGPVVAMSAPMEISLIDPTRPDSPTKLTLPPAPYDAFRVSPDETRIAFGNEQDAKWTVRVAPLSGETQPVPLTDPGSDNRFPTWARDGKRIAFQSNRTGSDAVWIQPADGTGKPGQLTYPEPGESHVPESFSSDGTLLYSVFTNGDWRLWTLSPEGGKSSTRPFGNTTSTDPMSGVFSHKGRLVAYTKTERDETTVCIERATGGGRFCLPRSGGDSPKHPQFSPDDTRLYYDPRIGDFESVTVVTEPTLQLVDARPVPHPFRLVPPGFRTPYDVTAVKGRFVGGTTPGQDGYLPQIFNKISVVPGWFEIVAAKARK